MVEKPALASATPSAAVDAYFGIFRNSPFGIYLVDADFCLVDVSKGCKNVFKGIEPLLGRDFEEILRTIWQEPFATTCVELFHRTLETGEPYQAADTSKPRGNVDHDESYDWRIERVTLQDGKHAVVCYFYDLSEQIHLQEALSESEARLREAHGQLEIMVDERTTEVREAHAELARLLKEVIAVQENERQRISRDVHDHLGGTLTGLRLNVESLLEESHGRPRLQEKIQKIQKIGEKLDSDISYLAWMLRPAILDDLGLVPALDCFVGEWSDRFSIQAEFKAVNVDDEGLDPDLETNLYRITQEALTNTAKHAQATSANVILEQKPGLLKLIIEDNGKGFSPAGTGDTEDRHGLGLGGMRDRARLVGASFEVESSENSGTSIFIAVPLS